MRILDYEIDRQNISNISRTMNVYNFIFVDLLSETPLNVYDKLSAIKDNMF